MCHAAHAILLLTVMTGVFFLNLEVDFLFRYCEFHYVMFPVSFATTTRYFLPLQSMCTRRLMKRWIICHFLVRTENAILWNFVWNNQTLWWKIWPQLEVQNQEESSLRADILQSRGIFVYICSILMYFVAVRQIGSRCHRATLLRNDEKWLNRRFLTSSLSWSVNYDSNSVQSGKASFSNQAVACAGKGLWTLRSGEKLIADPGHSQCHLNH